MNNILPRTRYERGALVNKDLIEQKNINQRPGYEARNLNVYDLLYQTNQSSSIYCPENERFDKDFSISDQKKRNLHFEKKQKHLEQRRVQTIERRQETWNRYSQQVFH